MNIMVFSYCFFFQCTMDCQKGRKSAKTTKFDLARRDPKFDLGGMVFWVKHHQMCHTKRFWGGRNFSQCFHPPTPTLIVS